MYTNSYHLYTYYLQTFYVQIRTKLHIVTKNNYFIYYFHSNIFFGKKRIKPTVILMFNAIKN